MKKEISEINSNQNWYKLKKQIPVFLTEVINYAVNLGININGLEIDHLGLRIKEESEVESLKYALDQISLNNKPISDSLVNGRPILIYKLKRPIEVDGFKINCIELPYPKTDHNYPSDGWEHIEIVLPKNQDIETKFKLYFPDFKGSYEISLPKTDSRELINETIVIKNPNNVMQCIKFHSNSIEDVVKSEL